MHELWRPIPGFEEYEASSEGRLRRAVAAKSYPAGYVLRVYPRRNGYLTIRARAAAIGEHIETTVSRLVALAFHGEPPTPEHEAAHIDGDKANNRPGNLCWRTHPDNMAENPARGASLPGETNPSAKLSMDLARACRRLHDAGERSIRSLATEWCVSYSTMQRLIVGETWREPAPTPSGAPARR